MMWSPNVFERIKRINPVGPSIFKEQKFLQAVNNPSSLDLSKIDALFTVAKKIEPNRGMPSIRYVVSSKPFFFSRTVGREG